MMPITLRPRRSPHHELSLDPEHEEALVALFGGIGKTARIGRIDPALARAIGANATIVMVSSVCIQKTRGKHSEITFRDLMAVQNGFNTGRVHKQRDRHLIFYYPDPYTVDRTIKAVVKTTKTREELFLLSIHRLEPKRLRAGLKRDECLRDWRKPK
jgi:hypothetical protein